MRTAFELAIEASYYAGELYKIVTSPEFLDRKHVVKQGEFLVQQYLMKDISDRITPRAAVLAIKDIFNRVENSNAPEVNRSLVGCLDTLARIDKWQGARPVFEPDSQDLDIVANVKSHIVDIRKRASQLSLDLKV